MIIEGKGDGVEDEDKEDKVEEIEFEKEDPPKKKGKVIITKPTKSSPTMFTRRAKKSKNKLKLGKDEAVMPNFNKEKTKLIFF